MGIYFYPRGGSAHSARALTRQLEEHGLDVTLLSGSRTDLGPAADARAFYEGIDVLPVDFTPALRSGRPLDYAGPPGTAPMHGSFEDRPDAPDGLLVSLDDKRFELQVDAWARELRAAAAGGIDRLYLHHLTPLNEAAARVLPGVPIIGHIHGTELLMLEQLEASPPADRDRAEAWVERLRRWAADCERLIVGDEKGAARAAALLDLPARAVRRDPERLRPRLRAPPRRPRRPLAADHRRRAPRHGLHLRRPLHRRQAPAGADRGVRDRPRPGRRGGVAGAGRRAPRRVGGRASRRRRSSASASATSTWPAGTPTRPCRSC